MACCQGIARKLQKGLKAPGWCGSLKLIALPLPVREGFRDKSWYDCGIERLAKPYLQTVQFRLVPFALICSFRCLAAQGAGKSVTLTSHLKKYS